MLKFLNMLAAGQILKYPNLNSKGIKIETFKDFPGRKNDKKKL